MLKLTKEEIEEMANELINQLEEEDRELKRFYEHEQSDVMERLYKYIKSGKDVDNESILYNPEEYPISSDEFYMLTTNLRNSIPEDEWFVDEENFFPNESLLFTYEEIMIELFYMYGQGTAVVMKKADDKFPSENIFKYEDMNPYIEK